VASRIVIVPLLVLWCFAGATVKLTGHLTSATQTDGHGRYAERLGEQLALVVEAKVAGRLMMTYNLHVESRGDDGLRCAQLRETLHGAGRYDATVPIVLGGDFNLDVSERAGATALSRLRFQDAFVNHHVSTTPDSLLEKGRLIHWIFTRGPVQASEPKVDRSVKASDHYPLSITVEFSKDV
jgi:endonuclease/exonuclease/phosphatase (EEP) superfamily protein YafD